jgi:hypothetical protein
MIPKIKFSKRIMTRQKKVKSKKYRIQKVPYDLSMDIYVKTSPMPPPALSPLFSVDAKHSSNVRQ